MSLAAADDWLKTGPGRNLSSEWERMKRITEEEGRCFVYAYIRRRDTETGKKGVPYYIGIASSFQRPFDKRHSVPVPHSNKQLIRVLRETDSFEEACEWEIFYIKHYGRFNTVGGPLLNRNDGGAQGLGRIVSEETRAALSKAKKGVPQPEHVKEAVGIWAREKRTPEMYKKMSEYAKNRTEEHLRKMSEAQKKRMADPELLEKISQAKAETQSVRYGLTAAEWRSLSEGERITINMYCKKYQKEATWEILGREWFQGKRRGHNRIIMKGINLLAEEQGITPEQWMEQNPKYGPFLTREMAIEKGIKQFYEGHVCPKGHRAAFVTSSRECKTCAILKNRKYSKLRSAKKAK